MAIARDHLDAAAVEEIVEADACDLSRWADHSFDVSLSLGPFYHLPRLDDRQQAVRELVRVTRPGGLVAVAMMPTYGYLRRTLTMPDERHRMADTTMPASAPADSNASARQPRRAASTSLRSVFGPGGRPSTRNAPSR